MHKYHILVTDPVGNDRNGSDHSKIKKGLTLRNLIQAGIQKVIYFPYILGNPVKATKEKELFLRFPLGIDPEPNGASTL